MPDSRIDFSDIPESTEAELKRAVRVGRPKIGRTKGSAAQVASPRNTLRPRWDQAEFRHLVRTWKNERRATSSSVMIAMHPAYQRIIGLGLPAVPLILAELRRELDHWFWALKAITGEDPVPPERRGNMKEMAEIWLEWGRQRGYVR
jgi:hypothetical protein